MGRPFILYSDDEGSEESCTPECHLGLSFKAFHDLCMPALTEAEPELEDEPEDEVQAILRWLFSLCQTAYVPQVQWSDEEASTSGRPALADSRIGGLPYLAPTESWPMHEDSPLTFVMQLRVASLPQSVRSKLGSHDGLFQVFVDESMACDGSWYLVRIVPEDRIFDSRDASSIEPPEEANQLHEGRITSYEAVRDWPHLEDAIEALPADIDPLLAERVIEALQDAGLVSTVSGDKLLGWPRWAHGPDWVESNDGVHYTQVLQLEGALADIDVGDSGAIVIQASLDRREFAATWACL